MPITETVRNLIAKNNLDKAILELENWAAANDQRDLLHRLSIHRQKLTQVRRNVNMGMLSFSEELRENAILANALLGLLDEIETPPATPADTSDRGMNEDISARRILFLASNPLPNAKLQLEKEFVAITNKMQDYPQFRIISQWATTPDIMIETILKYKPAIIHFSGHGTGAEDSSNADSRALALRSKTEPTGIILEDGKGGSRIVSGALLEEMFSIFIEIFNIEIIILNACYSEEQARIIAKRVKYVIGMTDSVLDSAAIDFSSAFYRNLGTGVSVDHAFRLAKNNVGMNAFDHSILAMYKDGVRVYS
jgi:hypothetical protein